jgi:hypothetical protein
MNIQEALRQYAREDLSIARDQGEMAICETKIGTIFVSYEASSNSFRINQKTMTEEQAVEFIANNFVIMEE